VADPQTEIATNEHMASVWMRGDGTGYYFDCPTCHFYKNGSLGICRRVGCGDAVVKVEIHVTSPVSKGCTDARPFAPTD